MQAAERNAENFVHQALPGSGESVGHPAQGLPPSRSLLRFDMIYVAKPDEICRLDIMLFILRFLRRGDEIVNHILVLVGNKMNSCVEDFTVRASNHNNFVHAILEDL
jgi:hypothetical protein